MTDGRTDRLTDGRTDGGDCNIPNAFLKKRGDKNTNPRKPRVLSPLCSIHTQSGLRGTVKPVLSNHSKIDKTKILMINGSLMKAESIAECSPFCNTFDLH